MSHSPRSFIKNTIAVSAGFPLLGMCNQSIASSVNPDHLDISIFSKHLQFLDYKATGQMAAELGFDGVDLTVRPKGHVLPENVITDLPTAIKDIKSGGSQCKMITTSIESVDNAYDVNIIKTAAE